MASSAGDITFIVPGQLQTPAKRADAPGTLKASVRVGNVRGGVLDGAATGSTVRVVARPGEDVVVLTIAGGPTLVLHPQDARDLMLAQAAAADDANAPKRGGATRGAAGADTVVAAQLGWPTAGLDPSRAATRGIGQAILSGFEVVTNLLKDPASKLVAAAATRHVDEQVAAGVYRLRADALSALKGTPCAGQPSSRPSRRSAARWTSSKRAKYTTILSGRRRP